MSFSGRGCRPPSPITLDLRLACQRGFVFDEPGTWLVVFDRQPSVACAQRDLFQSSIRMAGGSTVLVDGDDVGEFGASGAPDAERLVGGPLGTFRLHVTLSALTSPRPWKAMDFNNFECELCWARFNSPGELAEHEQQEQDRLYPIDGL